jgi:hypothetical protein
MKKSAMLPISTKQWCIARCMEAKNAGAVCNPADVPYRLLDEVAKDCGNDTCAAQFAINKLSRNAPN